MVVSAEGISPCVLENHGKVTAIVEDSMKVNELGFYDSGTGKHQSNTVYDTNGIIPALTTIQGEAHNRLRIMEEPGVNVIGQMDNSIDHTHESANRVYDTAGVSPCLNTCGGGGLQPKIVDDTYENREPRAYDDVSPAIRAEREGFKVVASRGRNPDNPNDRRSGIELEQRLEINEEDIANTLTSLTKDNMLLEPMAYDEQNQYLREDGTVGSLTTDGSSPKHNNRILIKQATEQGYIECEDGGIADLSFPDSKLRRGRVQDGGRVSPALTCGGLAGLTRIEKEEEPEMKANSRYRIRKLTPRSCWRLMSFTDEEFDRAKAVNCDSQLYKQAGNSIVVDVLVAIFGEIINADGTVNTHSGEQYDMFDLLGE